MLRWFKKDNSANDIADEICIVYRMLRLLRSSVIGLRDLELAILTWKMKTVATDTKALSRPYSLKIPDIMCTRKWILLTFPENNHSRIGYVDRCEIWIPQLLTETLWTVSLQCTISFSSDTKEIFFLKRLVTGDETWISYQNMHRKRIWSKDNRSSIVAKLGFCPKKIFLSIWWDWKDIVYYELLFQGNHQFWKILQSAW